MPRPDLARSHKIGAIQAQCLNCHTPYGGSAYNSGGGRTPAEVVIPHVHTGVEERHDTTSATVRCLGTRIFVGIAPEATETQVIKIIRAPACGRENMVDSKYMSRIVHAGATILAESLPPLLDTPAQQGRESAHPRVSNAAARRSIMSSHSCRRAFSSRRSALMRRRS